MIIMRKEKERNRKIKRNREIERKRKRMTAWRISFSLQYTTCPTAAQLRDTGQEDGNMADT